VADPSDIFAIRLSPYVFQDIVWKGSKKEAVRCTGLLQWENPKEEGVGGKKSLRADLSETSVFSQSSSGNEIGLRQVWEFPNPRQ